MSPKIAPVISLLTKVFFTISNISSPASKTTRAVPASNIHNAGSSGLFNFLINGYRMTENKKPKYINVHLEQTPSWLPQRNKERSGSWWQFFENALYKNADTSPRKSCSPAQRGASNTPAHQIILINKIIE